MVEDNALGDGCSVLVSDGTIHVFYEGDGRLRWARRPLAGGWNRATVDGTSARTGVFPMRFFRIMGFHSSSIVMRQIAL